MHHVRRVNRDEWVLSVFRRGASRQHVEALEPRRVMSAAVRAAVTDLVPPDLTSEQSKYYEVSLVPDADYHDREDGLWAIGTYLKADHQKAFVGKVATLHGETLGDPSSYRASLTIDGIASNLPLALRATEAGIEVDVETSLPMGWHKFAVTISDNAGRAAYTESAAFVSAPPIVGKGFTIAPVAGGVFTGEVAVFSGLKPEYIDDYVLGSNLPGSLSSDLQLVHHAGDDASTYRVVGNISYATPGLYDTTVSLSLNLKNDIGELRSGGAIWSRGWLFYDRVRYTDRAYGYGGDGASTDARGRAEVVAGRLAIDPKLNPTDRRATAGLRYRDTIAVFDRLAADAGESRHRFEVEVVQQPTYVPLNGDSPLDVPPAVRLNASMRINDSSISIDIDQSFVRTAPIQYVVRIYDGDQQIGIASNWIDVRSNLSISADRVVATEQIAWSGKVATIRDDVFTDFNASYAATIDWGDGTQSTGRVVKRDDGRYDIFGAHVYAQQGADRELNVTVNVSRTLSPRGANVDPTVGKSTLAGRFGERGVPYGEPRSSLVRAGEYDGFALQPYFEYYGPSGAGPGDSIEGAPGSQALLTLGRTGTSDRYTAWIDWSDGVVEPIDLLQAGANLPQKYLWIGGKRSFDTGGRKTGVLKVSDGSTTKSVDLSVSVQGAPAQTTNPATEVPYVPIATRVGFTPIVLTRDVESDVLVGRIKMRDASIDPRTLDVIVSSAAYARDVRVVATEVAGEYDVYAKLVVQNEDPSQAGVSLQITETSGTHHDVLVGELVISVDASIPDPDFEYVAPFRQFEEFTTTVATFEVADRSLDAGDFRALIDWGDGATSEGVITHRYKGHGFDVTGTHLYRVDGSKALRITIIGPTGTATCPRWMYVEHHPIDVASAPATTEGFRASGPVATFTDGDLLAGGIDPNLTRINHAALIDWGDGTISTGDIVATGVGTFDVVGDHTYSSAGDYTVKVMVRQNAVGVPQLEARRSYQETSQFYTRLADVDGLAGQPDAFWAGVEQRISIRADAKQSAGVASMTIAMGNIAPPLALLFTADKLFDADDADVLVEI